MPAERRRVLALPGLLCDDFVWHHQIGALADVADVTVADFSQLDDLTAMARAAIGLIPGPIDVVGHSMGGRIAFEVWRVAPERVRSLVVLDTGAHPTEPGEAAVRQTFLDAADRGGMRGLADAWLPAMVHPDRRHDPVFMAPLVDMVMRATPEQHARQIRALLDRPDATPLLGTITAPTLVVVARQDEFSPVAQHEEIAAAIATARLAVVEDSGHMVTLEQPDAVTALLRGWLVDAPTSPWRSPATQAAAGHSLAGARSLAPETGSTNDP